MLMSQKASLSHQLLASSAILVFFIFNFVSVQSHSDKLKYHNLVLRAVSMLRDGAKASLRSKNSNDVTDAYAEAAKAHIYVTAVSKLLGSKEISQICSVNIDELNNYTEIKLTAARTALADSVKVKTCKLQPSFLRN